MDVHEKACRHDDQGCSAEARGAKMSIRAGLSQTREEELTGRRHGRCPGHASRQVERRAGRPLST